MLRLFRRTGDAVMIGDDIKVVILNSSDGQVEVGFDAPRDIPILRQEVYGTGFVPKPREKPKPVQEVKTEHRATVLETKSEIRERFEAWLEDCWVWRGEGDPIGTHVSGAEDFMEYVDAEYERDGDSTDWDFSRRPEQD